MEKTPLNLSKAEASQVLEQNFKSMIPVLDLATKAVQRAAVTRTGKDQVAAIAVLKELASYLPLPVKEDQIEHLRRAGLLISL